MQLIDFTPYELSDELCLMIKNFMSKIGFFTGSIDILVDKAGRHWFLECNQDGAWGWLDDISSGQISRAFADELLKRLNNFVEK